MHISIVNGSNDLVEALAAYSTHLALPFTFEAFDKTKPASSHDFLVVHNQIPEKLDGLRLLTSLRSSPVFAVIPAVFISENLSESAHIMYDDVEFVEHFPVPFNSGKFFDACAEMVSFLKRNKKVIEIRKELEIAMATKDYTRALEFHKELSKFYDNKFILKLKLCIIQLNLGKIPAALKAAGDAVALHPQSLQAHNAKASVYMKKGDKESATKTLEKCEQLSQLQLKNLLHWGNVYMDRGESDKAGHAYGLVLAETDDQVEAKEGKLAADILSGRSGMVEECLEGSPLAMELARICNMRAITLANAGKFGSAETLYTNAMNFLSDKSEAYRLWLNLGLCMKKDEKFDQAIHYFKKCKDIAPMDFERIDQQIEHTEKLQLKQHNEKLASMNKGKKKKAA